MGSTKKKKIKELISSLTWETLKKENKNKWNKVFNPNALNILLGKNKDKIVIIK